ncbi:MAG: TerC family protein [Syntrophorhabdaceae bacterium]
MDFGSFGSFCLTWEFACSFLMTVLIDLVLAGDNAVVIAMAVRNLSPKQRKIGIMVGAGGAVFLRVIVTIIIAQLLGIKGLKLCGGVLIMWIALKLFIEGAPRENAQKESSSLWQAMVTITIADVVMSLDNMLAVAGASSGNNLLIIFGLVLSIPFVVFASSFLSRLMDKYPIIVYFGAMILGKVAGEMMIADPYVQSLFHVDNITKYFVEGLAAALVLVVGKLWIRLKDKKEQIAVYSKEVNADQD